MPLGTKRMSESEFPPFLTTLGISLPNPTLPVSHTLLPPSPLWESHFPTLLYLSPIHFYPLPTVGISLPNPTLPVSHTLLPPPHPGNLTSQPYFTCLPYTSTPSPPWESHFPTLLYLSPIHFCLSPPHPGNLTSQPYFTCLPYTSTPSPPWESHFPTLLYLSPIHFCLPPPHPGNLTSQPYFTCLPYTSTPLPTLGISLPNPTLPVSHTLLPPPHPGNLTSQPYFTRLPYTSTPSPPWESHFPTLLYLSPIHFYPPPHPGNLTSQTYFTCLPNTSAPPLPTLVSRPLSPCTSEEGRKVHWNAHWNTMLLHYAPINSKLQHPPPPPGIPRAFDFASCPGRGEFEPCVGRVGNLNRIYLLLSLLRSRF